MPLQNKQSDSLKGRRKALSLEPLEPRLALDSTGILVGIDPHLTLSFAQDGTSIGQEPSSLYAKMNSLASTADWQEAILRAFQTWAVNTNADIGLVSDGGQSFGIPGASQHDSRFGDIRVGASAMSTEVGAVSVPIDNLASGSWLADVIFNSQFDYQSLDEFYAVALHEAGNVFGLVDSTDPTSPLYSHTAPQVLDPTPTDIANLQSLHGVRAPDINETHGKDGNSGANDTFDSATPLQLAKAYGGQEGSGPSVAFGDIGSLTDQDYFVLQTPGDYHGSMTIQLTTRGVSLLEPQLSIYDENQQELLQSTSHLMGGTVLTLTVPNVSADTDYYFRVAGAASDVFGMGGFSLAVTFDGLNQVDQSFIDDLVTGPYRFLSPDELSKFFDSTDDNLVNEDEHTDDELTLGTELKTPAGFAESTRYETIGSISDSTDADYYKIKSPEADLGPLSVMSVVVRSLDVGGLVPAVEVLSENGQVIPSQTVVNGGGSVLVQLEGLEAEAEYSIRVSAADSSGLFTSGNYELVATFSSEAVVLDSMAAGLVGGAVGQTEHTLYVGRPLLFHFVLETADAAVATPTAVVATIKNASGDTITHLSSLAGETHSAPAVLLSPGEYTVVFTTLSLQGASPLAIGYVLLGTALSDPFVGDPADTTGQPFACPDMPGYFCYPGLTDPSPDPFLWDGNTNSLSTAPEPLPVTQLVDLLLGDWWSWFWAESGTNDPPLAQNDTFRTNARPSETVATPLAVANILANDVDPQGDAVVALLNSGVAHGTLDLKADGSFSYTPDVGFWGVDQFTYTAYDFLAASAPATVEITVQLAGDYDNSGVVDANDYAVWRVNFGSTNVAADGNGDGIVDAVDYVVWRNNLGASMPIAGSLAVAEPPPAVTTATATGTAEPIVVPVIGAPVVRSVNSPSLRSPTATHSLESQRIPHDASDNLLLLARRVNEASWEHTRHNPHRAADEALAAWGEVPSDVAEGERAFRSLDFPSTRITRSNRWIGS